MDFSSLPLFNLMKAKLDYTSERQSVLARNVANVDTPNYRAEDVKEPDFKRLLAQSSPGRMSLATTNSKHMSGMRAGGGQFRATERATTFEQSPTGNNVSSEEEMMRVAQNQMEYQTALQLYRKTANLFKTVLGNQGGGR